jgi:c-di-GMP-binding flagellar brake protein YcgR
MDALRVEPNPPASKIPRVVNEQRVHPRQSCSGLGALHLLPDGAKVVGALTNLSIGGCCIQCEKGFSAGEDAPVEVQLEACDFRVRLAGKIRHVDEKWRVGIQFVEVSPRKEDQIRYLMEELFELEKVRLKASKEKLDWEKQAET